MGALDLTSSLRKRPTQHFGMERIFLVLLLWKSATD